MEFEKFFEVEKVVGKLSIFDFQESVQTIADTMLDEGFEYSDIRKFLNVYLDEMLGNNSKKS